MFFILFSVGGGTPLSEIRLEEKRVALRRALKREYMKQGYDPAGSNATGGKRVFDAAFYRWGAIHNSQEILVRSSVRNFGIYFATFIIPVIIGTKIINSDMVSVQKSYVSFIPYFCLLVLGILYFHDFLSIFFCLAQCPSCLAKC